MKITLFSIMFMFFSINYSISQDTIKIQTLTYDSTGRSYVFDFPEETGQNYESIIMQYSMRCKDGKVSTGGDRNKGCGEWDYSCNTFITDSTLTDSIKATHPSHIISGFDGDDFSYTSEKVFSFFRYKQFKVNIDSVLSDNTHAVGNDTKLSSSPFSLNLKSSKSQYIFTSEELISAGLQKGDISAISLNVIEGSGNVDFLRIKMKEVDYDEFNDGKVESEGFEEVYFLNTQIEKGINRFNFYNKFNWDGSSNILIELSYTNKESGNDLLVEGSEFYNRSISNFETDGYLKFSGIGKVYLNNTDFSTINNEITVSFWAYGDEKKIPSNTTVFEGVDENKKRQANVHFPWSNSNIYWDCGNENNSYDRINKLAGTSEIKGNWNYWAFTKNATNGTLKIFKNGDLWHSGTGKTKKINIKKLVFGGSYNNNYSYYGYVDDFSIWNKELKKEDIKYNMYNIIDENNSNYSDLVAFYNLNEIDGQILLDLSKQKAESFHSGTALLKQFRGNDIFKNFGPTMYRPNISFIQGEYNNHIDEVFVLDSVLNEKNKIYYYKIEGTDLVLNDSLLAYKAGESYIYDIETGKAVDTVLYETENTINISTLNYYKKFPSRFELMSFVTPYGIGLDFGKEGKTWEFDVTDFKPILNGKKLLSVEFGKYQEELDIKFLFIKGTPPRNVNKIQQIWKAGSQRNYKDLLNDKFFEPRNILPDPNSSMFKVRVAVTGHGQEGEFIGRNHFVKINNGEKEFKWLNWKECADNPIYPQGGTWIYDRAGWCPGAPTTLKEFDLEVDPIEKFGIDYGIQTASGDSRYIINCQLVSYGSPNFDLDARIAEVQRPTKKIEFGRFNPICYDPIVVIQNTGKDDLQNITITYYVEGGSKSTFEWEGNLKFLEKDTVTLKIENTSFWLGDGSNTFVAEVSNPNSGVDEYKNNNKLKSKFELPDILKSEFFVSFRTNGRPYENKLVLKDMSGKLIYQKSILSANHLYKKELKLDKGCYELNLTDKGNDGLSFWANPNQGNGSLAFEKKNGIPLKKFNPDFGMFLKYSFLVGDIVRVDDQVISEEIFDLYPNPTSDFVEIKLNIDISKDDVFKLSNVDGQVVEVFYGIDYYNTNNIRINLDELNAGVYFITYNNGKNTITKKFVIQ